MDTLRHDLRYALRTLAKNPAFTLIAILALALGIGANTAIFTVVDGILLRPLPYNDPERLVLMWERSPKLDGMSVAYLNFLDWQAQNRTFEAMGARQSENFNLTGLDQPERVEGSNVSASLFDVLGVRPVLGRVFTKAEDQPGAAKVIVISHNLWERRFAKDPAVLGRSITLNGEPFTIVGVMPAGFRYPITAVRGDIWAPIGRLADRLKDRGNHPGIYLAAKLKPGVAIEQARADMETIAVNLERQYPDSNKNNRVGMDFLHERAVRGLKTAMYVMLGAVGFVLLIACANVANLLLARAAARSQEIAVRAAIGAGRGRIVRQLLTESLFLALIAGSLGTLIGYWGVQGLVALVPENTPRIADVSIDGRVLLFTIGVSILTGVLFGLLPSIQASRGNLSDALRDGGRRTIGDAKRHRLRNSLIVGEVALSLVLLIGAGLMIRSLMAMQTTSPGFDHTNVMTGSVALRGENYREPAQIVAFQQRILDRVKAIPGVTSAGMITPLPVGGGGWQTGIRPETIPAGGGPETILLTDIARVTPDYFNTVRVRLLKGRAFTDADRAETTKVAIIDETFANKHFANMDPIGKKLFMGDQKNPMALEVVGVVNHVKNYGIDQDSRIEMYLPFAQNPVGFLNVLVRTAGDPTSVAGAMRAAVNEVDPSQPMYGLAAMSEIYEASMTAQRLSSVLLGIFAAVALALSAIGLYGVISYSVTQRTREIGIRVALGAGRGNVLGMVVRQAAVLVGTGLVIGWIGSVALTRVIASLLFNVSARDVTTFFVVSLLLCAVAMLATLIPALRAARVDPMVALRYE